MHRKIAPALVSLGLFNRLLEEAATRYSACLINYAGISLPRLDLVLLGMGPDGHTASLFPGSATLDSTELVAIERNSPKPPSQRITFTYKLINNAANVLFMVTGADKANTLRRVLAANSNAKQLPSHGVRPTNGKLCWLFDEEAASELD
ncbi:MAG: 6-phosphogluconolactonase [Chthoniobacteraceae bacterium]